ncbi:F0F1 ATP synthase subunit B family protein [Acetobacter fallax]|uniref:ATP synthase subunit b n=1 Tax=Acetobacter fallax TaxID=1737473 RepID=A0ABX0K564_9PROT|nr:F0F1 ATP synthase subunit B [Acetobacter fallax]NHO34960.1 F0F1 ATP synthase subunit B [Acetobacter fallax]
MQIDWWTIGLQAINVSILIWLLARFFWKPLAAIIAERQKNVDTRLDALTGQEKQVAAERASLTEARNTIAEEKARVLAEAAQQAQADRAAILARAQQDAAALGDASRQAIAREEAESRAVWRQQAAVLAVDIAGRLLTVTGAPAAARGVLFSGLLKAVAALPERERHTLGAGFSIATAAPLSDAERESCETALVTALGAHPAVTWITDPALIEGFAIRTPHLTVGSNWQADLDRIRDTLSHADV